MDLPHVPDFCFFILIRNNKRKKLPERTFSAIIIAKFAKTILYGKVQHIIDQPPQHA